MPTIDDQTSALTLVGAMMIYRARTPYQSDGGSVMVSVHPVVPDAGGRPTIAPGRPMTEGDYGALVKAVRPAERAALSGSWISDRVLGRPIGRIVWWAPPRKRSVFFECERITGGAVVACPGLIFSAGESDLRIWAYAGKERPGPTTPVAQAPFFNVNSAGQVCLGNVERPPADANEEAVMDHWERVFFASRFTHPNVQSGLTTGVEPHEFWAQYINKADASSFPESVLVFGRQSALDLLGDN